MQEKLRGLKLIGKKPVICFGLCLGSVRIAEMVSNTCFDLIMVDLLHSHLTKDSATDVIRTLAQSGGPIPFGRVANNNAGEINTLLDSGATGIIVPMIESRNEAESAVESAYYPPLGKRSKGSPAAVFYGDEYYSKINQILNVIVMIETPEAASRAEEILSVPGISGCLIGAGDLSFIMKGRDLFHQFDSVVANIIKVAKRNNIAIGISVNSPDNLQKWWSKGVDFFLVSHDMSVMNEGIKNHEKKFMKMTFEDCR